MPVDLLLPPAAFVRSPEALRKACSAEEGRAYTRWLATHHYENFHVVSFLLPRRLHQDFYNVYSYCRWADDLGDEIGDTAASLRLLDWWRGELDAMYAGRATHPVLGRLVLYLCGFRDTRRQQLSDATCTALQLANFWQDVTVDLMKDRVYIPLDVMARHGYTLDELKTRRFTPAFGAVMREIVEKARELFLIGLPLARMVDRRLAIDLDLFSRGGMRVLRKIEQQGYNVLAARPAISKFERAGLLLESLARTAFR